MDHAARTSAEERDSDRVGTGEHAGPRATLDRLLELNHQRYAEEVAAGLHATKSKKSSGKGNRKKNGNDEQGSLL